MRFEEAEELELERRSDTRLVGFEPGTWILESPVSSAERSGFRWASSCQRIHGARPVEKLVKSLILVRLQAAIASGLAVRVVEMLDRSLCNLVEFLGDSTKISRPSQAWINERKRDQMISLVRLRPEPGSFQLEIKLVGSQHEVLLNSVQERVTDR